MRSKLRLLASLMIVGGIASIALATTPFTSACNVTSNNSSMCGNDLCVACGTACCLHFNSNPLSQGYPQCANAVATLGNDCTPES